MIPLFVSGIPRSGTTILQEVLDTHPEITCRMEFGLAYIIGNTMRSLCYGDNRVNLAYHLNCGDAEFVRVKKHLNKYLTALYLDCMSETAKPPTKYVGDKIPGGLLQCYQYLTPMFPTAKWIIIHRNPVDVLASMNRHPAICYLPWWEQQCTIKSGEILVKVIERKDNACVIQYEDFVRDPLTTLDSVAKFLDVPNTFNVSKVRVS